MPLLAVVFVVFLTLKLGVADTVVESWSWWTVTSPLWVPAAITLVFWVVGTLLVVAFGDKK
ncbi:hypothetical protein [Mycobacterium sp. Root265]|uniref:hypothetical protein n=1 Tax=Mycobacterium sp. Root265 TaxID=1736504 RepID=UPI000A4F3D84|nr:hypothetical protein [Mycobacterium sp. Root265]